MPAKLKEHFKKVHGSGKYKDTTLEELKQKRARYDAKSTITTYGFVPVDKPILTASYEVAYLIAKQGKPHTIGETLVKPAALQLANIMLGKAAKDKLSLVPLSNNVVSSRINDMSEDILSQVVEKLKTSPTKFSLQLDEITDVANFNQLLTFVRYVDGLEIKEKFLFCKHLVTTAKATDVEKILDDFFASKGLSWSMVSAVCTDGTPAMIGCRSGLRALIKQDAPDVVFTHCMLHRHALAFKTLPPELAEALKIVIESINYVRGRALNHRIFMQLCEQMDSQFKVLLCHSEVRWLSRENVIRRVFELRAELFKFLEDRNHRHCKHFMDTSFLLILAYLADIFGALNHLNCQMQGGGVNIIEAEEKMCVFRKKLLLWWERLQNDIFANFPLLDELTSTAATHDDESAEKLKRLKPMIVEHLKELERSFDRYFPEQRQYPEWIIQPFVFDTANADVNNPYLDDIIELQESAVQKHTFSTTDLHTFWCHQIEGYSRIAKVALELMTSFVTTYLCEQAFSILVEIKTKKRNRLECESDMRVALSKTKPRISQIVAEKQQQKTH